MGLSLFIKLKRKDLSYNFIPWEKFSTTKLLEQML